MIARIGKRNVSVYDQLVNNGNTNGTNANTFLIDISETDQSIVHVDKISSEGFTFPEFQYYLQHIVSYAPSLAMLYTDQYLQQKLQEIRYVRQILERMRLRYQSLPQQLPPLPRSYQSQSQSQAQAHIRSRYK